MLAQRLRRWPNIKTSLFQRVVFPGLLTLTHEQSDVDDTNHLYVVES